MWRLRYKQYKQKDIKDIGIEMWRMWGSQYKKYFNRDKVDIETEI